MSPGQVAYVIDASVAVKVFLPEPLSAEATTLLGFGSNPANQFHVPDLFFAECANIFWKQVQRGNASAFQVQADIARLRAWPLTATPTFDLVEDALTIALARMTSAYD